MTPLHKKVRLDASDPSNYKPISNLNTISKVLEHLLLVRLIPHVLANLCRLQSAYRQYHSAETALLRISNHLFEAPDAKKVTVVVDLDLSAAFDTIYYVLLQRLEHSF